MSRFSHKIFYTIINIKNKAQLQTPYIYTNKSFLEHARAIVEYYVYITYCNKFVT